MFRGLKKVFVALTVAIALHVADTIPSNNSNWSRPSYAQTNSLNEKEAFNLAKELGTIEGWEAFLKNYSSGFRADLARAYIRRLNSTIAPASTPSASQPVQQPSRPATTSRPLETHVAQLGTSRWRYVRYSPNAGRSPAHAASVSNGKLELLLYCNPKKRMAAVLRESAAGSFPRYDERIVQAIEKARGPSQATGPAYVSLSSDRGTTYNLDAAVQSAQGEVILGFREQGGGLDPNGPILNDLMTGSRMTIFMPPVVGYFQLRGSRDAICTAANRCGVRSSACRGTGTSQSNSKKKTSSRRSRAAAACRDIGMLYRGGTCVPKSKKDRKQGEKNSNKPCPSGMYRNPYGVCQPNETGG